MFGQFNSHKNGCVASVPGRVLLPAIFLLFALTAGSEYTAGTDVESQDSGVSLFYRPMPGDNFNCELDSEIDLSVLDDAGREKSQRFDQTVLWTVGIRETSESGDIVQEQKLTKLDYRKDGKKFNPIGQEELIILGQIINQPLSVTLNPSLEVLDVRTPKDLLSFA